MSREMKVVLFSVLIFTVGACSILGATANIFLSEAVGSGMLVQETQSWVYHDNEGALVKFELLSLNPIAISSPANYRVDYDNHQILNPAGEAILTFKKDPLTLGGLSVRIIDLDDRVSRQPRP